MKEMFLVGFLTVGTILVFMLGKALAFGFGYLTGMLIVWLFGPIVLFGVSLPLLTAIAALLFSFIPTGS